MRASNGNTENHYSTRIAPPQNREHNCSTPQQWNNTIVLEVEELCFLLLSCSSVSVGRQPQRGYDNKPRVTDGRLVRHGLASGMLGQRAMTNGRYRVEADNNRSSGRCPSVPEYICDRRNRWRCSGIHPQRAESMMRSLAMEELQKLCASGNSDGGYLESIGDERTTMP